ncbi:hypothetical protein ABMA28_011225 [Loxostege sticticalis]|uniref:Uncharacterized protein n=1 Tax=Loxostege sticticalis TaxID=481309 RepID=A0ABD0S6N9_LOXSC
MDAFLRECEKIKDKIDNFISEEEQSISKIDPYLQMRLEHLKLHLREVIDLSNDLRNETLLTSSMEHFIETCEEVDEKHGVYMKTFDRQPLLEDTKSGLENLTQLTKERASVGDIEKLIEQIDETIDLSALAKDEGLISESVDEFIKCCENMKKQLTIKDKEEEEEKPQTLGDLRTNIDGLINLIKDLKVEGLITESVEDFLKTCEFTKGKIDVYERYPMGEIKMRTASAPCSAKCTCNEGNEQPTDDDQVCENCEKMMEDTCPPVLPNVLEPCDSCRGLIKYEGPEEFPCESCSQVIEPHVCEHSEQKETDNEESPLLPSQECPFHPSIPPPEEPEPPPPPPLPLPPSPVDSSLGLFEKKIRKITRVRRTMNDDGTIREETETIIIRKNRHDPTETSFMDNDDDDYDVAD